MKVRIKFRKQGMMKFIGHLDMMRYFQKVMRRADVDIRYSEGFSPHQIMSFASPLGVGLLSNGEYVDIEVNSTKDSKTMIDQMNQVNVEGIEVTGYRKLPDSAKNAMSLVAAADYTAWLKEDSGIGSEEKEELYRDLQEFTKQDSIMILKKTKKGEKEMDLKPYIYELKLNLSPEETAGSVFMKLSAGSAANVKPELLIEAFYHAAGKEYSPFAWQIQREEVYGDAGDESSHKWMPLEAFGEDIE